MDNTIDFDMDGNRSLHGESSRLPVSTRAVTHPELKHANRTRVCLCQIRDSPTSPAMYQLKGTEHPWGYFLACDHGHSFGGSSPPYLFFTFLHK